MVTEYKINTNTKIQTTKKKLLIPVKAHKQNLPPCQHKVWCAHLKLCAHLIQSTAVVFRETTSTVQSSSCSLSSSVASSARGIANSVSDSDGVSDGFGSQQTLLFRLSEGPRRAFDAIVRFWIFWSL